MNTRRVAKVCRYAVYGHTNTKWYGISQRMKYDGLWSSRAYVFYQVVEIRLGM